MQRKFVPTAILATSLLASPGFAWAQASSTVPATANQAPTPHTSITTANSPPPILPPGDNHAADNGAGGGNKWGLIGLLGLLGLGGLRPRRIIMAAADPAATENHAGTATLPSPRV